MSRWENNSNRVWCEYLEANGVDPMLVCAEPGPRVWPDSRGRYWIWFHEFIKDAAGRKIISPDGERVLTQPGKALERVPPHAVPLPPIQPIR